MIRHRLIYALSLLTAIAVGAADKMVPAQAGPPEVVVCLPLGVVPGTNTVRVRGLNLTNATEIRFSPAVTGLEAVIKSKGAAKVPDKQEAKQVGDSELEVLLRIPPGLTNDLIQFSVVTPLTNSAPHALRILPVAIYVPEQEPNGGFRAAQELKLPAMVGGVIEKPLDVDVYAFMAPAGKKIRAEIIAARLGSPLDSLLTLLDEQGHSLSANDDSAGRDSVLEVKLPAAGRYFLSVQDANDLGGPVHAYLLDVRWVD